MIEKQLIDRLSAAGRKLAVAESCTGGMLGARITSVAGSSGCFAGGVISYSNELKQDLLGVDRGLIERYGAVSEQVAAAMAEGVCRIARSDIGVSITGIAGPDGGTAAKPVGLVYIGLAGGGQTVVKKFVFTGTRSEIRESAAEAALLMLMEIC